MRIISTWMWHFSCFLRTFALCEIHSIAVNLILNFYNDYEEDILDGRSPDGSFCRKFLQEW